MQRYIWRLSAHFWQVNEDIRLRHAQIFANYVQNTTITPADGACEVAPVQD